MIKNFKLQERIKSQLIKDNPQAENNGDQFRKLICPVCKKPEAHLNLAKGFAFLCPRKNNCGQITHIKKVYPELFNRFSQDFPPTKTDPKATARAYLESRGLNTALIEFFQTETLRNNKTYQVVVFKLSDGKTYNGRLIDCENKDKSYFTAGADVSGLYWIPPRLDFAKYIFITEDVISALSLIQSGFQAISILSANYKIPEDFFINAKKFNPNFIIAFDNDDAGRKAAEKYVKFFKDKNINYKICFPPERKN